MDETGIKEHIRGEQEFRDQVKEAFGKSEPEALTFSSETQKPTEKNGYNALSDGGVGEPIPVITNTQTSPNLGVICGPLLRYDTTVDGVWFGYVLVVTADGSSSYSPAPELSYLDKKAPGKSILQFSPPKLENNESFTFWRFPLEITLQDAEQKVDYAVNGGLKAHFYVPAKTQNMRWVGHSCNGFSSGVDTASFNGPSPLWDDVLAKHKEKPFHTVVGGGDQLYCDPIMTKPEFQPWVDAPDAKTREKLPLTEELKQAIDKFYFWHYSFWFRKGSFGVVTRHIPMLNMCDDHDIIDGFGSYPDDILLSPVFSYIGQRGFYWYKVFQIFTTDAVDGDDESPFKSFIPGLGVGKATKQRNTTYMSSLGPNAQIVMVDTRAERSLKDIVPAGSTKTIFDAIQRRLTPETKHLIFMLGVPIAYPRMTFAETLLTLKWNPLVFLAKHHLLGLSGFVNKFNNQAELLDDLNDHWCAGIHKKERNAFVVRCRDLAKKNSVRISFLSGDVHCASASYFSDWRHVQHTAKRENDPAFMLQIVSSAIVNTPPPEGVIRAVNHLGKKKHHTLERHHIAETMIPLFEKTPTGEDQASLRVMGHRNYSTTEIDSNGNIHWDIVVEKEKGSNKTTSYSLEAPPLQV